jgi:phosphonate transport system ATP-binding protein
MVSCQNKFLPKQDVKLMVNIHGLIKEYPKGPQALKGVDLSIGDGQIVALIGPSGAGKSTLIRCINRLIDPTAGLIDFNGIEMTTLSNRALRMKRRDIGMIFQEYALVERLSVMENVLSGQLGYVGFWKSLRRKFPQDVIRNALKLLERVGLSDYVDTRVDALSGGQRQRVGIARALVQQPDLLLVDEPTASLDPKTARQIMRLIVELVRERQLSAIINIHDVQLAKSFTERIVGLRDGLIVFDGTPAALNETALTEIYGEEDWETDKQEQENMTMEATKSE